MKLAFIIDLIAKLDPAHDTSVALMEAACRKGYEVFIADMNSLSVKDGKAWALLQATKIKAIPLVDGKWQVPQPWYEVAQGEFQPLENMQFVWMRPDPPVTTEYLYATYILDYVDASKTRVLNSPKGIRAANEKMYALQFTGAIPKTIVTADKGLIIDFVETEGKAVMKPLGGKGGEGILFLEVGDRNINSLIEISTNIGKTPVMVQEYLPDAQKGDKRIILLDGEPIGAVNRVPKSGEFRGNMAVGGSAVQVDITDREREICAQLAPTLKRDGLMFVGIDVIGGYLTEVNVTSPTGIREIDRLDGVSLGDRVMDWLAIV
ncbi:glutathione synthase [Pseudanabaena sp. FACHB-1998]|uniref:glutathione synthase n=1 Tax=Pseudanabaena sp. FACHB-1998 TaxID=2692858 RepID=UPI0016811B10|nr:glutathione synthase [Pseudanabaena sp. FACHB-1998]MBD2176183.1 glutathione synthase [Pseudanabaena sp. FACHB-1998]